MKNLDKKILAIIPARGGSKGIPRKNIKIFSGKPLIAWSIEVAKKSGIVGRLIVSTDNKEIAEISKKLGAEVPFIRPAKLARDDTPTLSVLQHAISFLKKGGYNSKYVLLLEPTSPCRRPFHLKEALALIEKTGADSVIALGEVPKHFNPSWQFKIKKKNKIETCTGEDVKNIVRRRQDLTQTYFRNGAFYLFKTDLLFGPDPNFYGDDVRGYIIEERYSVDIDGPEDWKPAEKKFKLLIKD